MMRSKAERSTTRSRTTGNAVARQGSSQSRSEEHTSELQSRENLVCRLLLEKKNHPSPCTEPTNDLPTPHDPFVLCTFCRHVVFSPCRDPRDLPSFPTRRSSDLRLGRAAGVHADVATRADDAVEGGAVDDEVAHHGERGRAPGLEPE